MEKYNTISNVYAKTVEVTNLTFAQSYLHNNNIVFLKEKGILENVLTVLPPRGFFRYEVQSLTKDVDK